MCIWNNIYNFQETSTIIRLIILIKIEVNNQLNLFHSPSAFIFSIRKKNSFIGKKINVIIFKTCFELAIYFLPYSHRSLELVHCSCKIGTIFLKTHVLQPTKALDWDLLRDFCNFIRNNNNTSLVIWDVWRNNFRAIPHQKIKVFQISREPISKCQKE